MDYIRYKGKGEHSINELEKIIEQREFELHTFKTKEYYVNEMREMIKTLTSYVYRNEKFPEKFNLWLEATNLIKEIEKI